MSKTSQKLVFTHPVVVLKSGLKNNWMKKLDSVNRPLHHFQDSLSPRVNAGLDFEQKSNITVIIKLHRATRLGLVDL